MDFNITEYFDKETCSYCTGPALCVKVCLVWLDIALGVVHLFMGVVGIFVSAVALYLFYNIGQKTPYYMVIAFETLSDFIVSGIALYTAAFLLSGRDGSFDRTFACEFAGMLWNWNMVITPLLLSVAGVIRVQAIFWPHNTFLSQYKFLVTVICLGCYLYGGVFATFPYFYKHGGYKFYNDWSVCDYNYEYDVHRDMANFYLIIMGPIPMVLSLLCIVSTNTVIVIYLIKRYKKSWIAARRLSATDEPSQGTSKLSYGHFITHVDHKVQSKHVVISLLIMTIWYMACYSVIIYKNFANLYSAWVKKEKNLGLHIEDSIGLTYFYATYNFLAYLNSFVNPFILLMTGNNFRLELVKAKRKMGACSKSPSGGGRIPSGGGKGHATRVGDAGARKCSLQVPLRVPYKDLSDSSVAKADSVG